MVLPVNGLKDFKKIIARQMVFQLIQDNFLKNLWDERQIWHGSKVLHIICVESRLLQEWCYNSLLELGRDYTRRKRGINSKRDQRNKAMKALFGEGSRDRIKHATFRRWLHVLVRRSPVQTELWTIKNGKSRWLTWARVQVVTDTVSLIGEKVTKPIGQIGTGDVWWESGGAGLAQLSSLDTAKSCLQKELKSIFKSCCRTVSWPPEHTPSRQPAPWRRFPCGLWDGSLSIVAPPVSVSVEPPWFPRSSRGRKGGLARVWWRTGRGGQELNEARHCRHRRG